MSLLLAHVVVMVVEIIVQQALWLALVEIWILVVLCTSVDL